MEHISYVKGVIERRRYKRHKVQDVSVVVGTRRVGHILEMSMGGLAFSYVEYKDLNFGKPEPGIIFGKNGRYLEKLPVKIVSDSVLSRGPTTHPVVIRRCSLQFLPLSEEQHLNLEAFIRAHSNSIDS